MQQTFEWFLQQFTFVKAQFHFAQYSAVSVSVWFSKNCANTAGFRTFLLKTVVLLKYKVFQQKIVNKNRKIGSIWVVFVN